jgi:hypothetical protein
MNAELMFANGMLPIQFVETFNKQVHQSNARRSQMLLLAQLTNAIGIHP